VLTSEHTVSIENDDDDGSSVDVAKAWKQLCILIALEIVYEEDWSYRLQ
jgi:hypothetical protein